MTFGDRVAYTRKKRGLTQAVLGKEVGTSGDIIGKYEREEMKPSIETARKLADVLGVSLDYLTGRTNEVQEEDPETVRRIREIGSLGKEEQERIFMVIDALLRDFQAQSIYKRGRE